MAVARLKLANPQPLVSLEYHRYQVAFMEALTLRVCPAGHTWHFSYDGKTQIPSCPRCSDRGSRGFKRFLLRAGRRGGKTRIGALSTIRELSIPEVWWWLCAPTYPELEDFVLPAFFKQIPQAWLDDPRTDWSESEYTLILPNRAVAQFRSLEDAERGRGPGLHGLWIDEVCKLTLKHWETIRPTLVDHQGVFIGTTTPKGEDWVHETFYERAEAGRPGYWACHYSTLDNPFIAKYGADEVAEAKESMSELMFRQEFLADIVTFTGSIYGEIIGHCEIEGSDDEMRYYFPEWPRIDPERPSTTGLDPGTDHPFAGVHLVQSPRGLVAVGEYEERSKPLMLHAQSIQQMRRGASSRVGIDRSQAQVKLELAQYGLYTIDAENDVIAGIGRVSAWMLASRHPPDKLPSGLVLPRRHTPKLIRALKAYRWAESEKRDGSVKQKELVYKKKDDLPDALRYGLMTYPLMPKGDPGQIGQRRDLSGMPANTRIEIERMRRIEAAEQRKAEEEKNVDIIMEADPLGMGDTSGMFDQFSL